MIRYINMPKLVAWYLREFSNKNDGSPSDLYRFVFCLCLPFVSRTFYRARMIAIAIAECTNSKDQILRLLSRITGAQFDFVSSAAGYMVSYDGSADKPEVPYNIDGTAMFPYGNIRNNLLIVVALNGSSKEEIEGYVNLLIPFYVNVTIIYND